MTKRENTFLELRKKNSFETIETNSLGTVLPVMDLKLKTCSPHNGAWAPVPSSIARQASGAEGVSLRSHPVWKATRGQEELVPLRGQPRSP